MNVNAEALLTPIDKRRYKQEKTTHASAGRITIHNASPTIRCSYRGSTAYYRGGLS